MKNSELFKLAIKKGLRIGNIDIETSPMLTWHYGHWKVNLDPCNSEVETQITSIVLKDLATGKLFAYEWDRPKGKFGFLTPDKDKKMLIKFLKDARKYDILIGQNHKDFDIRTINWRANCLDLEPFKDIIAIDTMVEGRRTMKSPSNKQDYISQRLGFGGKIKQDMSDCIGTAKGDKKISDERLKYNKKDVQDNNNIFWHRLNYFSLPKNVYEIIKIVYKY